MSAMRALVLCSREPVFSVYQRCSNHSTTIPLLTLVCRRRIGATLGLGTKARPLVLNPRKGFTNSSSELFSQGVWPMIGSMKNEGTNPVVQTLEYLTLDRHRGVLISGCSMMVSAIQGREVQRHI